ncbi:LytR C-terminal domain-containing protein, partial [Nocardia cyriacigeorgica]
MATATAGLSVTVDVFNASLVGGLAGQVSQALSAKGFQ